MFRTVPLEDNIGELRSTTDIARELRVSSSYVRRLCRMGKIPALKMGAWLIPLSAFSALVAEVSAHSRRAQPVTKLTPGRGVVVSPRAHGYRSLIHKKKKDKVKLSVDAGVAVAPPAPLLERISQPEDNKNE